MTIPIQIEHGNHGITAHVHTVPRVGEHITCAFPASGIPKLFLIVDGVFHHQLGDFDGRECPEPLRITVTTAEDPQHVDRNRSALAKTIGK